MTNDSYEKPRPAIPAELRRAVEVESGHACAVKACRDHTYLEIHHIDENRDNNVLENLILLCDKHHKMAHSRVIDRKALRLYKSILVSAPTISTQSLQTLLVQLFGESTAKALLGRSGNNLAVILNPQTIEELQPYIQAGLVSLRPTGALCNMGARNRIGNHVEELKRPYGFGNGFVLTYTAES